MKKYSLKIFIILTIISLISTSAFAAPFEISIMAGLDSGQTATVNYSDWLAGTHSTLDISLSNIPADGLPNGTYIGWCIQPRITELLHNEAAILYTSLSNALPSDLAGLPWNEINYLLNHKIRGEGKSDLEFFKDVQTAIWLLLGDTNPEFGVSPEAQLMVDNATAHTDYVPGNGDIVAIIVYSDGISGKKSDRVQETIIEVKLVLPPTPTPPTETGTPPTGTATPPTGTATPPTETGTPPTGTSTPPTGTSTPPTETGTPPTGTTTPPTETGTPPTGTATPATGTATPPTGTSTPPTGTTTPPTGTATPPICQPVVVIADFSNLAVGQSVEGLGVVAPGLNIDAIGTAVKVLPLVDPTVYFASVNGVRTINGHMVPGGGFSDIVTQNASQAHLYTFTFTPGTSVSNFSLHMLDFGDLNPTFNTNHYASMTAYNGNGIAVSKQELSYITLADSLPLVPNGDASAPAGQPGNWTWNVSGSGIVKVVLEFGVGYDPNVAFDILSFTTQCPQACQPTVVIADFSNLAVGQSVEGLGVVAPGLNIDAKGTAIKVLPQVDPILYMANQNNTTIINGYLNLNGGFSDLTAQNASQAHLYTFTFTPGTSVSNFSLHMLDFGDLNPTNSNDHYASMTAYDSLGNGIAKQEISYNTLAVTCPPCMAVIGDASAAPGQLGNWTWNVSGPEIVKVVLEFGVGYDPNIAFDTLTFTNTCP